MISEQNLIWIDLEMTGLSPDHDVILEIASLVTDNNLTILAKGPDLVIHHPEKKLQEMNDWVFEMHTKSGLIQQVQASKTTMQEAEKATLEFIQQFCNPETSPLCGNSVWQDKAFLHTYMHKLNNFFHYRIIDVSTIKELTHRWYPEIPEYKKEKSHRALDDIQESIDELKFYREKIFIK